MKEIQAQLFDESPALLARRLKGQLLKWVGNKQRMAVGIAGYLPTSFETYYEPFIGSGAVMATVAPERGFGSDVFKPLMEIWQTLKRKPKRLKGWYEERWHLVMSGDKVEKYEEIKASYNRQPNGADLLFLCRSCYGGVVRFRRDGYMSTPCGAHVPISPESFSRRVDEWHSRLRGSTFELLDYREAMARAGKNDVIYCDPPYSHSQAILYGAQDFSLTDLLAVIEGCKSRGVRIALSIDGSKRSGDLLCDLPIPEGLFEREVFIQVGRSMLRRFQMGGNSLEKEVVADRLLLTF